jgi:hypothetical protein
MPCLNWADCRCSLCEMRALRHLLTVHFSCGLFPPTPQLRSGRGIRLQLRQRLRMWQRHASRIQGICAKHMPLERLHLPRKGSHQPACKYLFTLVMCCGICSPACAEKRAVAAPSRFLKKKLSKVMAVTMYSALIALAHVSLAAIKASKAAVASSSRV